MNTRIEMHAGGQDQARYLCKLRDQGIPFFTTSSSLEVDINKSIYVSSYDLINSCDRDISVHHRVFYVRNRDVMVVILSANIAVRVLG